MRYGRSRIRLLLVVLCLAQSARAQIEKQAETYDLTLEDCLATTLTQNPEIQQLRKDVERAAGTRLIYRSHALPQLAGQTDDGLRGGRLYPPSGPYSIVTAEFSQPLLHPGIPPTLRRGRLEVVLAQQSLNRAITDRLHEARLIFLQAQYFRDFVAVYEELDQRLEANARSEQQRLDVGAGSEAALKSAKIQRLNLEVDLANLRTYYFSSVSRIAQLCGRDPAQETNGSWQLWLPKPIGPLQYEPASMDLAGESVYAREHRADLKLLQALVDATAADKQTVRAQYLPAVSLVASGLFIPGNLLLSKQTSIVAGQDPRTSQVEAGVSMSWRVIDNGQVIGASRQLAAIQQSYEIILRQLQQNIPRELATVAGSLQSADARREAFLKSVESAEENLRLVEAQVALGEATQFDFLKAQTNLLAVRAGLLNAVWAHEAARAELDHVTGRYLQYDADAAP
jgi:outer membrane protein TolC